MSTNGCIIEDNVIDLVTVNGCLVVVVAGLCLLLKLIAGALCAQPKPALSQLTF